MFSSLGYVSLYDVFDLSRTIEERRLLNVNKILAYFVQQPSFSFCTPSGGIVRVHGNFLLIKGHFRSRFLGVHPAIDVGTMLIDTSGLDRYLREFEEFIEYVTGIGPAKSKEDQDERNKMLSCGLQAGRLLAGLANFNGCAVQISEKHAPKSFTELLGAQGQRQLEREADPDADLLRDILTLTDGDEPLTRDEIRTRLCPDMKIEVWRAIWGEARKVRPQISKPGPRRSKK